MSPVYHVLLAPTMAMPLRFALSIARRVARCGDDVADVIAAVEQRGDRRFADDADGRRRSPDSRDALRDREDARQAAEGHAAQRRIDQVVGRHRGAVVVEVDGLQRSDRRASRASRHGHFHRCRLRTVWPRCGRRHPAGFALAATPSSRATSRVCSPSAGASPLTTGWRALILTGKPSARTRSAPAGTSRTMSSASNCGSRQELRLREIRRREAAELAHLRHDILRPRWTNCRLVFRLELACLGSEARGVAPGLVVARVVEHVRKPIASTNCVQPGRPSAPTAPPNANVIGASAVFQPRSGGS